jgi:predicted nucleotidyltransferase
MDKKQSPISQTVSTYSKEIVELLSTNLDCKNNSRSKFAFVVVGSFARGEASECSDLDFFVIYDKQSDLDKYKESDQLDILAEVKKLGIREPSDGGAFGVAVLGSDLFSNIGGDGDTNENITRRVLFLLESKSLCGHDYFDSVRRKIINSYVTINITDHQMCKFLLNDIIRYYRTICVDFEYKVSSGGKSWGDRNIKLVFSRKLLYFSGVLIVAETAQNTYKSKVQTLLDLMNISPIERIERIAGSKSENALSKYKVFLEKMSDESFREFLKGVSNTRPHHEKFRELKNEGHHFTWELSKLLNTTYDSSHPIHLALIL